MRAMRTFTVRPKLPEALQPLHELAMNLSWSWDERTRDLFRWVDPATWEVTGHDPVRLLGLVGRDRLEALATDSAFLTFLDEVYADLERALTAPRWFQSRGASALRAVAYFSPEFGIAEALPQYSGGLGVLAGDHLKAASGLGIPLVGVGLFYRQGYFRQELNADGWQQERFPTLDPHAMALTLVDGATIEVDLAGVPVTAHIWRADVGRVRLYLLDTDVDENDAEGRLVTDRLYGGGAEHRIRQEILLGMGGVRALDAVGEPTQVFHTNEGHAGFLGLERIRRLMTGERLSFDEAIEAVRAGTVFTTHTPVSAGIDRFP
ncbi:MAG: alpha-glucan family phosphorylase, partial [Actinobacteria bacterium]|nr:alpha-glucan family phosphorylase [Actinomycetota bacterium]